MKIQHRSRTLAPLLAVLVLLASSAIAFAQPPGRGGGEGFEGRGAHRGHGGSNQARSERLFELLDMDENQQQAWKTVLEESKVAAKPIFQEMKANREALHDAVEAGTDAGLIGELTLQGKALREQLSEHHEGVQAELDTILDAEQREKYEAFKAARSERGPRGRRGRGGHGGRGGRPGTGEANL